MSRFQPGLLGTAIPNFSEFEEGTEYVITQDNQLKKAGLFLHRHFVNKSLISNLFGDKPVFLSGKAQFCC